MRRSISRIVSDLAADDPDRVVVTDAAGHLSAGRLDAEATRLARALRDAGVRRDDLVAITLPNDRSFVIACAAVWRAGATPLPLALDRTSAQRTAVARVAKPAAAIGAAIDGVRTIDPGAHGRPEPLPDLWAASWKAPTSSGSTGEPKVVVAAGPALFDPTRAVAPFLPLDAVQLVAGPLSHSAVFTYAMRGLLTGHQLVVLPHFDEHAWIDAVDRFGVTWALVVPTMMHRILRLDPSLRSRARTRTLRTVLHMGAPCRPDLKHAFLHWLGPERVVEVYAGSESNGLTMIRGDEWLAHPGSVGRPIAGTEIRIRRPDGSPADPGETGEVWLRRAGDPAYRYLGAASRRDDDGWDTLRDIGRLDEDGRLYLVDRLDDVIVRGGEKIYPVEIEAVLERHPLVRGAVAFGVADTHLGERVGAVVDVGDAELDAPALRAWAAASLDRARVPETIHVVREPVRDDSGKTSRRSWAETG